MEWLKTQIASWTAKGITTTLVGLGITLLQLKELFIISALIGVYLMIFGQRNLGTKFTSISILIYFLAEVMSKC